MYLIFTRHFDYILSGGSTCDLNGKPRQVEVRLKCRESGTTESLNAVSLYLLEPEVCSYILGVESPILCHLLDGADENGLISAPVAPKLEAMSALFLVLPMVQSTDSSDTLKTLESMLLLPLMMPTPQSDRKLFKKNKSDLPSVHCCPFSYNSASVLMTRTSEHLENFSISTHW